MSKEAARPGDKPRDGPEGDAAVTATKASIARRSPLLGQVDLRCVREAAVRVLHLRGAASYLDRRLSCGELQLIAACDAICEIVVGELGEDANGDSVGDLVVREVPGLPLCHQPRLGGNGR